MRRRYPWFVIGVAALSARRRAPGVAAVAVRTGSASRGRAICRQRRLGRDQRPFTVNKFHTMRTGAAPDAHRQRKDGRHRHAHRQRCHARHFRP